MDLRPRRPARAALLLALAAAVAGGCGGGAAGADGELLVFAAASLTDAFSDVGEAFAEANPGTEVQLNTGASSSLRVQVLDGAPADVFAPADPSHLDPLRRAGQLEGDGEVFARNRLQLVVPAGNPGRVAGLADLAQDDLLVGLCAEGVPCGDLARAALAAAGVTAAVDTAEPDVRSLLSKVEAGELDVGVVYRTDVAAAGDAVEGIDLPDGLGGRDDVVATYRIAVLAGAPEPDLARAFVDFVTGPDGRAILAEHGFDAP